MLTSIRSKNITNTDFIAYQLHTDLALKEASVDSLGDIIPGVPFEVTYADDVFDGERELLGYKRWKWDQGKVPQDQVKVKLL